MHKININTTLLILNMPQIPIYLNKEETEDFDKACDSEKCSRYALAKQWVMAGLNAWKEENVGIREESDGKPTEDSEEHRKRRKGI